MIFIDTSIWIQYFRGRDPLLIQSVHELLDQDKVALSVMVWLELLSGVRQTEIQHLKRVLSALPKFFPSETSWSRLETWVEQGLRRGQRFSATDLLIASIAVDTHSKLWSLDSDYQRMQKLGFLTLYHP